MLRRSMDALHMVPSPPTGLRAGSRSVARRLLGPGSVLFHTFGRIKDTVRGIVKKWSAPSSATSRRSACPLGSFRSYLWPDAAGNSERCGPANTAAVRARLFRDGAETM